MALRLPHAGHLAQRPSMHAARSSALVPAGGACTTSCKPSAPGRWRQAAASHSHVLGGASSNSSGHSSGRLGTVTRAAAVETPEYQLDKGGPGAAYENDEVVKARLGRAWSVGTRV